MGHGGMTCGMKTMRFIMVVVNLLFVLIGLALLGVGIYVMVDPSLQKIQKIFPMNADVEDGLSYLKVIAIVIIVLGGVLLIIGFLGCCGAMKQVKIFLILYTMVVGLIILFEIGITIYFFAFKSKFEENVKPKLQVNIRNGYEGPLGLLSGSNVTKPGPVSIAWDFIMYNFECCGVDGASDFNGTNKWDRKNIWWTPAMGNATQNFIYPLTCCKMNGTTAKDWNNFNEAQLASTMSCAVNGTGLYQGCYNKFLDMLNTYKTWIIVGAVVVLVIELLAFSFALALCCRKRKDTMYYSS